MECGIENVEFIFSLFEKYNGIFSSITFMVKVDSTGNG